MTPMPMNFTKTAFLLALLTGIFVVLGNLLGGRTGMVIAFFVALAMNLFSLWKSDKIVLSMQGAQQVDETTAPDFVGIVRALAERAGLPMPKVYVVHSPQPNAFATGRSPSSAAVCASTGLLEMLTREEVAGVMAHELAHVKNRDTLTMTMAATIGGAISMLAQWMQFSVLFGGDRNRSGGQRLAAFAAMLIAPFAAMIVQMAISRSREYQADRLGAMICGNPLWLASALHKIQDYVHQIRNPQAEAVPAMAHLFIINPLTGRGVDNWFSTHPNTENRIAELEKMAAEQGLIGAGGQSQMPAPDPRYGTPPQSGSRGPWG